LIVNGGGFELLLKHIQLPPPKLKKDKPTDVEIRNQYYALAGLYNLSEDAACAAQIVERGVDKTLEQLAKSPNEETSKHATFTLKNLQLNMGSGYDSAKKKGELSTHAYMDQQMKKLTSMFPKLLTS
ncbi:hypothetical protein T492DRAFT_870919, partial [Pavlovales sp. CCMP2436]